MDEEHSFIPMFNNPSKSVPSTTLELSVRFLVPAKVIFEALTTENMAQFYTQSACRITPQPGGDYYLYNESVQGQFVNANTECIELKWRRREWEDGVYSIAKLELIEIEKAVTEIHLIQNNIPKADRFGNIGVVESISQGWIEMIFRKIGMFMGYTFQTEKEFD